MRDLVKNCCVCVPNGSSSAKSGPRSIRPAAGDEHRPRRIDGEDANEPDRWPPTPVGQTPLLGARPLPRGRRVGSQPRSIPARWATLGGMVLQLNFQSQSSRGFADAGGRDFYVFVYPACRGGSPPTSANNSALENEHPGQRPRDRSEQASPADPRRASATSRNSEQKRTAAQNKASAAGQPDDGRHEIPDRFGGRRRHHPPVVTLS